MLTLKETVAKSYSNTRIVCLLLSLFFNLFFSSYMFTELNVKRWWGLHGYSMDIANLSGYGTVLATLQLESMTSDFFWTKQHGYMEHWIIDCVISTNLSELLSMYCVPFFVLPTDGIKSGLRLITLFRI